MPNHSGPFARLSLGKKVPLVAGGLVLTVAAATSIASYLEVRHTARRATYQHIDDVVQLVNTSPRTTGSDLLRPVRAVAQRPAVGEFVNAPDGAHRTAALSALLTRTGSGGGTMFVTEIRDSAGRVLLSTNPAIADGPSDFPPRIPPGDSGSVGRA